MRLILDLIKKIISFLAAITVSLSMAAELDTESEHEGTRSDEAIIQDMIVYYGCYEDEAEEKEQELLSELRSQNKRKAALWSEIMDYWKYANSEMVVNTEKLPNDLPKEDNLCIIVLGFELNADGSMQNELVERLKLALKCAKQYPKARVICTGGGTALNRPDLTEADLMGKWLVENGLSKRRLSVENKSLTTAENANNTYEILRKKYPQVDSVVLISSSYHIPWGALMFESAFRLAAFEENAPEIHVISNCSCPVTNNIYRLDNRILFETGGMLQMIGNDELADQYYYNWFQKPEL